MKIRIKSTGEVVDAKQVGHGVYSDIFGATHLWTDIDMEADPICLCEHIDWEQRRYEIAKSAMQGLIANNNLFERFDETGECAMDLYTTAVFYADELIKQLKGGDK